MHYRDFAREARAFLEYLAGSEDQPRVPAGSPDGGEFGSGGGKAAGADDKKDLHVSATREQWSKRPNRESLSKRLGNTAIQIRERDHHECQYCHKPEVTVPPAKISNKHALDHRLVGLIADASDTDGSPELVIRFSVMTSDGKQPSDDEKKELAAILEAYGADGPIDSRIPVHPPLPKALVAK